MVNEDTAVLLLSHGSSLSYAQKVFSQICEKFSNQTGLDSEVGYMKVSYPNVSQAVHILNDRNPNLNRIIALPVFLADGIHTTIDIPIMLGKEPLNDDPRLKNSNSKIDYLEGLEEINFKGHIDLIRPIGPNPKLVDIINNRVEYSLSESKLPPDTNTGVLLICHGSRLKYNKEFISDLHSYYAKQSKYISNFGFMELVEPDIPTSANKLIEKGVDRLVVVPVFIAPGIHTKIDIKTILGLIHNENNDNNSVKQDKKKTTSQNIPIGQIILEKDPDHEHKYDETVEFDGEILYSDPIGADDILIDILDEMVQNVLVNNN